MQETPMIRKQNRSMPEAQSTTPRRELDRRAGDGIVVTLLWDPATGRVSVALDDARAAESYEFEVPPDEALAAFHHPYAYAIGGGGDREVVV
jgi:hypothetical protein